MSINRRWHLCVGARSTMAGEEVIIETDCCSFIMIYEGDPVHPGDCTRLQVAVNHESAVELGLCHDGKLAAGRQMIKKNLCRQE